MKAQNVGTILVKLAVAGLLLWALARHPYSYYTLLRWITCAAAIFAVTRVAELERTVWLWVFVIVAILFNPIVPIHLKRETWAILDVVAAAVFLLSITVDVRHASTKN